MNQESKRSRLETDYRITSAEYCVECNIVSRITPSLLRDREEYDEKKVLTYYFNASYKVFLNRISRFKELTRQVNAEEQKDLVDMLATLIDTQRLIYEVKEEKSEKG